MQFIEEFWIPIAEDTLGRTFSLTRPEYKQ